MVYNGSCNWFSSKFTRVCKVGVMSARRGMLLFISVRFGSSVFLGGVVVVENTEMIIKKKKKEEKY